MPSHPPKEPDGIGAGKPDHPFAVTVEAKVPVSTTFDLVPVSQFLPADLVLTAGRAVVPKSIY